MKIGDWTEAFDFGCDYLRENGGSPTEFNLGIEEFLERYLGIVELNRSLGRAFFNALSSDDQEKIRETKNDPFYSNEPKTIWNAIEYLMEH